MWSRVQHRDAERRLGHRALTLADLEESMEFIERPDTEELALFNPPST